MHWTGWIWPRPKYPQRLIRQLLELDADYVEALWGLDQPPGKLSLTAMLHDTPAALEQLDRCLLNGSAATSHQGLNPHSCAWKLPSARNSIRPRPTIWSRGAIPKSVKHPPVNLSGRQSQMPYAGRRQHSPVCCPAAWSATVVFSRAEIADLHSPDFFLASMSGMSWIPRAIVVMESEEIVGVVYPGRERKLA